MQVIRHGNTYKEKGCKECGALLSYSKTDIKIDNRDEEYGGDYHYSYRKYIICPECNSDIDLSWVIDGEEQIKHEETK